MARPVDSQPGWETLVAAFLAGGAVHGKQTLVKVLSLLQLEGFPVDVKFKEFARGPHSFEVHDRALAVAERGELELKTTHLGGLYEPRSDYELTESGRELVRAFVQRVKDQEEGEVLADIIKEFSVKHNIHRPGNMLSRYIHDLLTWDDEDLFMEEFRALHDWFERRWRSIEDKTAQSDEELLVAAAIETVVVALRAMEPKIGTQVPPEDFVGIRFARYNASNLQEDLIALDQRLDDEETSRRLRRHLHAFESNATRYGFLEAMDEDELDGLLREAGRFHSNVET